MTDALEGWTRRRLTVTDTIAAAPIAALAATLDQVRPEPGPGDEVPPGWHWLYALPKPRRSDIGPDGHGKRGGFLPPIDLPRRMFAASPMTFHQPLRVGDAIRLDAEVADVAFKEGRTGRLA
jgi:3-methylfumaryl-CoA hydratase